MSDSIINVGNISINFNQHQKNNTIELKGRKYKGKDFYFVYQDSEYHFHYYHIKSTKCKTKENNIFYTSDILTNSIPFFSEIVVDEIYNSMSISSMNEEKITIIYDLNDNFKNQYKNFIKVWDRNTSFDKSTSGVFSTNIEYLTCYSLQLFPDFVVNKHYYYNNDIYYVPISEVTFSSEKTELQEWEHSNINGEKDNRYKNNELITVGYEYRITLWCSHYSEETSFSCTSLEEGKSLEKLLRDEFNELQQYTDKNLHCIIVESGNLYSKDLQNHLEKSNGKSNKNIKRIIYLIILIILIRKIPYLKNKKTNICNCKTEEQCSEVIKTDNYYVHYDSKTNFVLHSKYTGKTYYESGSVENNLGYTEICERNGYTLFVNKDKSEYVIFTPKEKFYLLK